MGVGRVAWGGGGGNWREKKTGLKVFVFSQVYEEKAGSLPALVSVCGSSPCLSAYQRSD